MSNGLNPDGLGRSRAYGATNHSTKLGIPIVSLDSDAPDGTIFVNDTAPEFKVKQPDGTVFIPGDSVFVRDTRTLTGGNAIDAIGDLSTDRTVAVSSNAIAADELDLSANLDWTGDHEHANVTFRDTQDPAVNGEIRRNGTDLFAFTGGVLKNLTNIGSGSGGALSDSGRDNADGGDQYVLPQVEDSIDLQDGGELDNASSVTTNVTQIDDTSTTPTSDGEIRRNGTHVYGHSAGKPRNFTNIKSGYPHNIPSGTTETVPTNHSAVVVEPMQINGTLNVNGRLKVLANQ